MFGDTINFHLRQTSLGCAGNIELSFYHYWSILRRNHPVSGSLHPTRVLALDASTSTVMKGNFTLEKARGMELMPSPEAVSDKPLAFWRDADRGLAGVSSYVECISWKPEELKDVSVEITSDPGDRGETYETSNLTVSLTRQRQVVLRFVAIQDFDANAVMAFYAR
ncbi:MAG: hypothetical protein ABJD07_03680 [Gemmatimonadaceae bacterium]